jgi:DNA-binding transcriptional LysR family regulator
MNSRFLETFVWLATLKSFRATAERLNISQPVVSTRIAALEKSLGVQLYHGSGKSFELTSAGRRILDSSETIVLLCQKLEKIAKAERSSDHPLRVGIPEVVALSWLPDLIAHLAETLPDMTVDFHTGMLSGIHQSLRDGQFDIAFTVGEIGDHGFEKTAICQYPVSWFAKPGYIKQDTELSVLELGKLPLIMPARSSYRYQKMIEYFEINSVSNLYRNAAYTVDGGFSMETCAYLVSRGLGLTAAPLHAMMPYIERGELVELTVRQELMPWYISACFKTVFPDERIENLICACKFVTRKYAEKYGRNRFRV